MKLLYSILFLVAISLQNFAQNNVVKHIVQQGETVTQIAIKYKTTPVNIFKLNPDAQSGIKANMVLLINNNNAITTQKTEKNTEKTSVKNVEKISLKPVSNNFITHITTTKETIYSLAIQHKTTVEAIEKANPKIAISGLKIGDTIKIPSINKAPFLKTKLETKVVVAPKSKLVNNPITNIYHTVLSKETKFSISQLYGITIEELEKANPEVVTTLNIGTILKIVNPKKNNSPLSTKIFSKTTKPLEIKTNDNKPTIEKQIITTVNPIGKLSLYTILQKETLYSLSKKFAISINELLELNPSLHSGVKENDIIKVPADVLVKNTDTKIFENLLKSIKNQEQKKLVLLLPFNINKIENDTVNTVANRIKTDKFLNMTLDFYAGALVAIDSAKTLGINLEVKILDSQETKSSSGISTLIQTQNLANSDAMIGPFYQSNAEKAALLLADSKTFIISPLSKEKHLSNPKLIVANADNDAVKQAIFDFMKAKNGNVIAVIDNKKLATKQFLKQKQPQVKLLPINEKNTFVADSLAYYCSKSQTNYVILDSEKTGLILKTTAAMINLQKDYQMQLVILEKNETLDFDEIPLSRLTKLKMIYPSLTRDNETAEAKLFEKEFKKNNKVAPSSFATRGFDLTFDTILRLAQERTFEQTISETYSEQIDNKFEYEKNSDGGFYNKGIYILEYQTDMTIKEVK